MNRETEQMFSYYICGEKKEMGSCVDTIKIPDKIFDYDKFLKDKKAQWSLIFNPKQLWVFIFLFKELCQTEY